MSEALTAPRKRIVTLILLAICALLTIAAVFLGVDDNPPGILAAFLAAVAFVLAFVHPWRTARKFLFLLLASILGFVLFIVVNIISDSISQNSASGASQNLMESPAFSAFSVVFAMVCSAALIVGIVGSIAMAIRGRRKRN